MSQSLLRLNANEGCGPSAEYVGRVLGQSCIERYPSTVELEAWLGNNMGVDPRRVVVTAGGDDALKRICFLAAKTQAPVVLPVPTFGMLQLYLQQAGAETQLVPWASGDFPTEAVVKAAAGASMVCLVTPNNPTGLAVTKAQLAQVNAAPDRGLLLIDLAYDEFAAAPLLNDALLLPNAVVVRTLSKAWGIAGARVGYAVTSSIALADELRALGQPYSVASTSLTLAAAWLTDGQEQTDAYVQWVPSARSTVEKLLTSAGFAVVPGTANFAFARGPHALSLGRRLAALGVAVRTWPSDPKLRDAVRITCPNNPADLMRLENAFAVAYRPEAILFDIDGVLADVRNSYDQSVIATAQHFGVVATRSDIELARSRGNANDDWRLTQQLLEQAGTVVSLDDVTRVFEAIYQGNGGDTPGLKQTESLLIEIDLLQRLRGRVKIGAVTGRPKDDAVEFLRRFAIESLFEVVVTREDAPLKPSPAPVELALKQLGVARAWMIGDTRDDQQAARAAGVLPLGFAYGEPSPALLAAGAADVIQDFEQIATWLEEIS